MAEKKTDEKQSSGKGKFLLGAALGALAGAVAGHFVSKNVEISREDECDCDCDGECKCEGCECKEEKDAKEDKKVSKKEEAK